ncbi:hypothetical protein SAMN05660493_01527 [Epilithonimonas bovis DSM 19482]|uniref:Uncharacterized protein n=1 Tax=Epilithonimonas bovis DSM 19482 TaxID=1121284 RepID=A0A1U7PY02_9FLAO|nr:hypothetical protein [Epilithonimonas bovis]SIT96832.1 hypothetical protein SAMN05660493_01527 [Epilithonimonas bovis DSM 19482]
MEDIRKHKLYDNVAKTKGLDFCKLHNRVISGDLKYLNKRKERIENELVQINLNLKNLEEKILLIKKIKEILLSQNIDEKTKVFILFSYIDEIEIPKHIYKKLTSNRNRNFNNNIFTLYDLLQVAENDKNFIEAMGELHKETVEYFKSKGFSFGYKF